MTEDDRSGYRCLLWIAGQNGPIKTWHMVRPKVGDIVQDFRIDDRPYRISSVSVLVDEDGYLHVQAERL